MRIKNWRTFQHYKNRRPPWIKLYREILDDPEWFKLPGDASKMLVMCWLIASEYEGELPDIKKLSFRLRIPEKHVNDLLSNLSHWIEIDASNALAQCYQDAIPEGEGEKEREKTPYSPPRGDNQRQNIDVNKEKTIKKPLTDIQKVVKAWKIVTGALEDEKWDKLNFARCSGSAKKLLDYFGDWRIVSDCIEDIHGEFTKKGLTTTLETIVKHATEWKIKKEKKDNGILSV